jgi:hypothetical protein
MSQHFFETMYQNEPVRIMMGWDRPLQYYFLLIEKLTGDEKERIIWSNLDHFTENEARSLENYLSVLNGLCLAVPEQMIAEIGADAAANCGNKEVRHFLKNGRYAREEAGVK